MKRDPVDRSYVNVHAPLEVRYWCAKWGCTEAELRVAVKGVGSMADKVQAYLKKREVARVLWREGVR